MKAMTRVENFNESLESELSRLGDTIAEQRAVTGGVSPEREMVKESLKSFTEAAPSLEAPAPAIATPATQVPLPGYLEGAGADPKAQQEVAVLTKLVFSKGLAVALAEAKRRPPFIEDAFHDELVDVLLPILKQRGLLP